jgi:hypothetical protein
VSSPRSRWPSRCTARSASSCCRAGSPRNRLTALSSVDPQPQRRQVAVLGVNGDLAAYTGEHCVDVAGHLIGDTCVALANMAASPQVWDTMVERFENSGGPLAQRLLSSLQAAEEAGGDFRERGSAAMLVIRATTTGRPWHDTVVDLRVDDSRDPVAALADLLGTRARYTDVVRARPAPVARRGRRPGRPRGPRPRDAGRTRPVRAAVPRGRFGKAGLMPADLIERILPAG